MGNCGREASFDQRPKKRRRRRGGESRAAVRPEERRGEAGLRNGGPGITVSLRPWWDPPTTKKKHLLLCYHHTGPDSLEYTPLSVLNILTVMFVEDSVAK